MPIIFISLSETYTEKIKLFGFEAKTMKIQDYIPNPNKKDCQLETKHNHKQYCVNVELI